MSDKNAAAQLLLQARKPGKALTALPKSALPADKAQAYAAQAELVSLLSIIQAGRGLQGRLYQRYSTTNACARLSVQWPMF